MTSKHSDFWLWAGLVVLGYYSAMTIHTQLVKIHKASEVTQQEKPPDMLNQRTEDALKLETLGQLAQNSNQDVRAASIKILCERSLQDGAAWRIMLRDMGGPNNERRDRALTCLRFVLPYMSNNQSATKLVRSFPTYKAIVRCLCGLLPEARIAEAAEPSECGYRSQPERDAVWILDKILPYRSKMARRAGMISRWLAHYPFGGVSALRLQKKRVMLDIVNGDQGYEDSDFGDAMQNILDRVFKIDEFKGELKKYDLFDMAGMDEVQREGYMRETEASIRRSWQTRNDDDIDELSDVEAPSADTPYEPTRTGGVSFRNGGGRHREESMEEQALRRRRRMAMVLGENGRPIQSGDIIQRDPVTLDDDVEEELEQLIEEVTEAEQAADTGWWGLIRSLTRPRDNGGTV